MTRPRQDWSAWLLPFALVVVGLVAYLPHLDLAEPALAQTHDGLVGAAKGYYEWASGVRDDYEYTLHVDENHHWAQMAQLQRQDSIRHDEPYTGRSPAGVFQLKGGIHEKGFHISLAQFQDVSGIGWPVLFRFLPTAFSVMTAWALWAFLSPWKGVPLAALFVALLPTTPRFIGPAFLVPIGASLAWLPLVGLLARDTFEHRRMPFLLVFAIAWSFFLHFIAGFGALLLVASMLPWVRHRRLAGILILSSLVPVLWLIKNFLEEIAREAERTASLPLDRTIFDHLGTPFLLCWIVGLFALALKQPRRARAELNGLAVASLVVFLMIGINLEFSLRNYFLYERWHQPFLLFAAAPAAYGILSVVSALWHAKMGRHVAVPVAAFLLLAAPVIALDRGVDGHLEQRYYHVLEARDFEAIQWAQQNLGDEYTTFLGDPVKAPIVNAMTGRRPIAVLYPGTPPVGDIEYAIFRQGGFADGPFLVEIGATWILDAQPATAPEYERIGPDISVLRHPWIDRYNNAVQT